MKKHDAFMMKERERFCGFRGQQRKNEWVFNKAGVKREHTMRKQGSCLEKEIMQETMAVHAGEEDHARPGWTTSICGQDYPCKSPSD